MIWLGAILQSLWWILSGQTIVIMDTMYTTIQVVTLMRIPNSHDYCVFQNTCMPTSLTLWMATISITRWSKLSSQWPMLETIWRWELETINIILVSDGKMVIMMSGHAAKWWYSASNTCQKQQNWQSHSPSVSQPGSRSYSHSALFQIII